MTRQKRIVGIHEDMPGMRGRYPGKEIVRVAHHHARFVKGHLGMKQDLRDLRHARYGFYAEVAEGVYSPGILISFDEPQAVGGGCEKIQDELGVCFDRVDA